MMQGAGSWPRSRETWSDSHCTIYPSCDCWHISASALSLSFHCVKCEEHLQRLQGGCREMLYVKCLQRNRPLIPISESISQIMVWGQIQSHDKESVWGHTREERHHLWPARMPAVLPLPACWLLAAHCLRPPPPDREAALTQVSNAEEGSGAQGPIGDFWGSERSGSSNVLGHTANLQTNLRFWK